MTPACAAQAKIAGLDLEALKLKLMQERTWTHERADHVENFYRACLALLAIYPGEEHLPAITAAAATGTAVALAAAVVVLVAAMLVEARRRQHAAAALKRRARVRSGNAPGAPSDDQEMPAAPRRRRA